MNYNPWFYLIQKKTFKEINPIDNEKLTVVSFYTENTLYEKEIQNLIASCEKHSIHYDIAPVKNLKNWNLNCHLKPPFILDRLKKHGGRILWLDADSVIHQPLSFFETCSDEFMVRMRDDVDFEHFDKVISSTVFAQNTPLGLSIVKKWCHESSESLESLCDQECLKNALKALNLEDSIRSVPIPYCKIEGLDEDIPQEEIYIQQFQVSRLLRKIIDEEVVPFSFLSELPPEDFQKVRFSS